MNGNGNGKKKRNRRLIYIGIGVVLFLGAVIGVIAAARGGTKIDPSKLAKVERGDLAKSVVATGKVEPITKVEIKSKASGIVKKLYVDAGDRVKKGQLLAELDKEEIEARVAQAKAQTEASEASLKGTQADLERAKVDAEGPDVPMLKRAYDRAQGMAKEGVVSQSALDDAQKNYEMSLNKQNVSKAQLQVLHAHRWNHPVAGRGSRRRGELDPGVGIDCHPDHDRRRHQRSVCEGKGRRERYR